jgi:nocturnin
LKSAYELQNRALSARLSQDKSSEDTEKEEEEEYYTTWKIRETGEQKQILDYIFYSEELAAVATLAMPTEEQIGADRLPSLQFASDHLSLVADFALDPQ